MFQGYRPNPFAVVTKFTHNVLCNLTHKQRNKPRHNHSVSTVFCKKKYKKIIKIIITSLFAVVNIGEWQIADTQWAGSQNIPQEPLLRGDWSLCSESQRRICSTLLLSAQLLQYHNLTYRVQVYMWKKNKTWHIN